MFNSPKSGFRAFSIAEIDVFFSYSYLFFMLVIGVMTAVSDSSVIAGVAVVLALTLSLLIHEFGHALVAKSYKLRPNIVLHGLGGTCVSEPAPRDLHDFLVTVAGPAAEIIAGLLVMILSAIFVPEEPWPIGVSAFLSAFIFFSIIWGCANLVLPVYPLDGGRIFLLLMRRFTTARKAASITLKVSIVLCVAGVISFLYFGFYWLAMIVGLILFENYEALKTQTILIDRLSQYRTQAKMLLEEFKEIERHFKNEDWREASRRCHLLRSTMTEIPDQVINRVWYILGVSAINLGEYEEALEWLKRAPQTEEIDGLTTKAKKELEHASSSD